MKKLVLIVLLAVIGLPLTAQDLSTAEQNALFRKEVKKKLNDLENHLKKMANKKIPYSMRMRHKRKALKMFDANATMEVSSKYSNRTQKHKVSAYFQKLIDLKYSDVKIHFEDEWVSNVRKNRDGTYRLEGVYIQFFQGLDAKGKVKYQDKTAKKVDVKIALYEDAFGKGFTTVFHDTTVLWTK